MVPAKTPAVSNLVGLASEFTHLIYSMNRIGTRWGVRSLPFGENRVALAYGAPPKGLLLATGLRKVSDFILDDMRRLNLTCDVVHAHKFSIEGLVALWVADALGVPMVSSLWGNTDARVMRYRPDLRQAWQRVADRSTLLLPAAPWAAESVRRYVCIDPAKVRNLPIAPSNERFVVSAKTSPRVATVLHLDGYANKGVKLLVRAIATLHAETGATLDIVGGGSPSTVWSLHRLIERWRATDFVRLIGPIPNARIIEALTGYAMMALPSRAESYGLAFVEALFAGIPVLLSRGRGIDGYLPAEEIGYACDPYDSTDIVRGIRHVLANQTGLKASIARLQGAGALQRFRRESIAAVYDAAISEAVTQRLKAPTPALEAPALR
jgi:glycosyltransferase involved in cell wall biosynthesis